MTSTFGTTPNAVPSIGYASQPTYTYSTNATSNTYNAADIANFK